MMILHDVAIVGAVAAQTDTHCTLIGTLKHHNNHNKWTTFICMCIKSIAPTDEILPHLLEAYVDVVAQIGGTIGGANNSGRKQKKRKQQNGGEDTANDYGDDEEDEDDHESSDRGAGGKAARPARNG